MKSARSLVSAYRVQVLDRAIGILDTLAETRDALGAAEIAERVSLHKSTIHRLLTVLEEHQLIRRNSESGKYSLGLRLFQLGNHAIAGLRLAEQARPFLLRLVRETGETAHVCVLDGCDTLSVANVEGPRNVRMPATVGRRTPAHCTGVGKAMLAYLPTPALEELLATAPLRALTPKTLVTRRALLADLEHVRLRGYAIDDEEVEIGLRCIGAPVRDHSGDVVASMSIAGPVFRVRKQLVPVLSRSVVGAARDLSAELGYHDVRSKVSRATR
jgi:DNA-binding IclR family transcriptional regulator